MITSVERNAVEAAIAQTRSKLLAAVATAQTYDLTEVAERLEWSRDFLDAAHDKLPKEGT